MLIFKKYEFIHVTGTCSFVADFITIQFVQSAWAKQRKYLNLKLSLRTLKDEFQIKYDYFFEKIFFKIHKNKKFISISKQVTEDLQNFFKIKKIYEISHGINLQEFRSSLSFRAEIRNKFNLKAEDYVVLFVGAFERKGLGFLIKALNLITDFNCTLLVVGNGPQNEFSNFLNKNSKHKLIFSGSTKEVYKFYPAADIFILPSLYDPFGLVGIEAMASRIPSILSKQSGCSDLLKNRKFILSEPWNENEIADKIRYSHENRELSLAEAQSLAESLIEQSWDNKIELYRKYFAGQEIGAPV